MLWQERPGLRQAFAGEGVTPPQPRASVGAAFEAGFEGGVAASPGGVNLSMSKINMDAARRASEVLGEEVLPLNAGVSNGGLLGLGDLTLDPPIAPYTAYLRAAYEADSFRPDSGDERRIIGDKYKIARELGGKSEEQFKRARELDPSIPDLEEQRRQAIAETRSTIERSSNMNTGLIGTAAWLVGQVRASFKPETSPSYLINLAGIGGRTMLLRLAGQGVAAGGQALVEDVMPLDGLPSRTEAMSWMGLETDVTRDVLTAVAVGAAFQGFGEIVAKGFAYGASKARFRDTPPSERIVLDAINPDPAARVRNAQDLDAVARQLDAGVPANEIKPPAAPLGEHASVMPDSRASVEPVVRDVVPMTEEQLITATRAQDKQSFDNYAKATKQAEALNNEIRARVEAETTRFGAQIDRLDKAIAEAEAKIAELPKGGKSRALNDLEALQIQHEIATDLHAKAIKELTAGVAKRQATVAASLAKWEPLVTRARARALGEWEARAGAREQVRAAAASRRGGEPPPTGAAESPPAVKPAPARPIGEPIERPAPETSSPFVGDTGEGSVLERVQRVASKNAMQAAEEDKAWLADMKTKLADYETALKSKGAIDPDKVTLLDGTPIKNLLGLEATDTGISDGQVLGSVIDLRRELDELGNDAEVKRVVMGCQTRF